MLAEKRAEYTQAIVGGERIKYSFHFYDSVVNDTTLSLISGVLGKMQLTYLQEVVFTFVKEMTANAVRANLKRIYFKEQGADIHDPEQYEKVMATFKADAVEDVDSYKKKLKDLNFGVEIALELSDKGFEISIINNVGMVPAEKERIGARLEIIRRITNIGDAFDEITDTTEGAGLGIVLNLMLLKNCGVGIDAFSMKTTDKLTQAKLLVPRQINKPENLIRIQEKLVNAVDGLPTFPESIHKVMDLCDNPDSQMSDVSHAIELDPALASDIIKLGSSSGFMATSKGVTVSKAVTALGLKVVKTMAQASATRKLLNENLKIFKGFWSHAFQVAFYSKFIAERTGLGKDSEVLYLGGLLHDLGKMVLYTVSPSFIDSIADLTVDRVRIEASVLDEANIGTSHALIGAKVAQKWNFSQTLIDIIEFHHCPFVAQPENIPYASVVHLADALFNIEKKRGRYGYVNYEVQDTLQIKGEKSLEALHKEIQDSFSSASQDPFA